MMVEVPAHLTSIIIKTVRQVLIRITVILKSYLTLQILSRLSSYIIILHDGADS